jgi:hypothetical protein
MHDEAEGRLPSDNAVLGVCELLGLLFGLPFGEDLYRRAPVSISHWFYLAAGILFAALGPIWPSMRKRFPKNAVVLATGRAAYEPRNWILVLLVFFVYLTRPASPPTAEEIANAITSAHAPKPNQAESHQSAVDDRKTRDALKVAQNTIADDASQIRVLEGEINSFQQKLLPQPAAKPVPPKKFYSQKQKDQLADMIESLTATLGKQSSEMMQKESVSGIASDIMLRSERMSPPLSPTERASDIVSEMTDIQNTAVRDSKILCILRKLMVFIPTNSHLLA